MVWWLIQQNQCRLHEGKPTKQPNPPPPQPKKERKERRPKKQSSKEKEEPDETSCFVGAGTF